MPSVTPPKPSTGALESSIWSSFVFCERQVERIRERGTVETTVFCNRLQPHQAGTAVAATIYVVRKALKMPVVLCTTSAIRQLMFNPWFASQWEPNVRGLLYGVVRKPCTPFVYAEDLPGPRYLQILSLELLDVPSCQ